MVWKYTAALNVDLSILFVIGTGILSGLTRLFNIHPQGAAFSLYVFKLGLPALVIRGFGLGTNLYNGDTWRFIATFLLLRAFALVLSLAVTLLHRGTLGTAMVYWIASSWISTVILGVPVIGAVLGQQYANLGVLAGISSFIFQLPLQLILLEIDWAHRNSRKTAPVAKSAKTDETQLAIPSDRQTDGQTDAQVNTNTQHINIDDVQPSNDTRALTKKRKLPKVLAFAENVRWKVLGWRLLNNHVLWGVLIGLILSLSKIGPKYLEPTSKQFVQYTGFIAAYLDLIGRCAEPLALLSTGLWMVFWAQTGHLSRRLTGHLMESFKGKPTTVRGVQGFDGEQVLGGKSKERGTEMVPSSEGPAGAPAEPPSGPAGKTCVGSQVETECVAIAVPIDASDTDSSAPSRHAMPNDTNTTNHTSTNHTTALAAYQKSSFMRHVLRSLAFPFRIFAYMVVKLLLIPMLAVGCAKIMHLPDAKARAAVLIAILPISPASFALAVEYGIGEQDMALNVVFGTALLLPATIAWLAAMDSIGLFVP